MIVWGMTNCGEASRCALSFALRVMRARSALLFGPLVALIEPSLVAVSRCLDSPVVIRGCEGRGEGRAVVWCLTDGGLH